MAELATGAVSTLLGVISNEVQRLGRVRGDVQFIQEEMESMSSFLENLERNSREHDGQVRTWMNQVRLLANDCNTCIDLFLYRGNPDFHLARRGPRRYLLLAPWLLRKLQAQYRAAAQLRELRERARDIGERRLRYGVEVKKPSAGAELAEPSSLAVAEYHGEEEEQDGGDPLKTIAAMSMGMENYFKWRLDLWFQQVAGSKPVPSIAFVVPEKEEARTLAHEALAHFKPAEEARTVAHGDEIVPHETKGTGALANGAPPVKPSGEGHEAERKIKNVYLVDILEVHYGFLQLQPLDILYYILRELEHPKSQQQATETKWDIYQNKRMMFLEITQKMGAKIENMTEKVNLQVAGEQPLKDVQDFKKGNKGLNEHIADKHLEQLLWLLIYSTASAQKDQDNKAMRRFADLYHDIIKLTADKLKGEIEVGDADGLKLEVSLYEDILLEVFQRPTIATNSTDTPVQAEIKEIVKGAKEILHELWELDKSDKKPEAVPAQAQEQRELDKSDKNREAAPTQEQRELDKADKNRETGEAAANTKEADSFKKTIENKMKEIQRKIGKQLRNKGIMQKIQNCLGGDERILVILRTDHKYVSEWKKARNILIQLGCTSIAGAVIVARKTTQQDIEYRHDAELELIEYSRAGRYFDAVLQCTRDHINEDGHRFIRKILDVCEPDEFCMKIFAHALYAKPERSIQELRKLHSTLDATQKSLPSSIAWKMFKFSYNDLPKEYRSCLLYLAIFPKNQVIRRSTLIGRWVAEGLITTKDWRWSSSMDEAEKCFDTLIARCLVCPVGIGAAGRVKSCTVHKLFYGLITEIAKKQSILETRLSHHLAHHFSIFSDVRLRSSDKIEFFLQNIPKSSSQFSKLKVLDLEDCRCLAEKPRYLRDICNKILMLKYLSLRGTDVTWLPSEINNLHDLEVLDIRQTNIPPSATRYLMLRKLKHLLAGRIDPSPSSRTKISSVVIPEKIEKMVDVAVLYNVHPHNRDDLRDITTLNHLKKLGVVINKENYLQPLLGAVSDLLDQALRSLSITLNITRCNRTSPELHLKNKPKVLQSLSINESNSTLKGHLLKPLADHGEQLAKVTLIGTLLSQDDLNVLSMLPNLYSLRLQEMEYTDTKLIFDKGEFQNLNNFLVGGTNITEISFENGAASKLEKIVWSFTKMESLSGIDNLLKIKELEFSGDTVPKEVEEVINRQHGKFVYKHNKPENQAKATETAREADGSARCPSLTKGWCWSN